MSGIGYLPVETGRNLDHEGRIMRDQRILWGVGKNLVTLICTAGFVAPSVDCAAAGAVCSLNFPSS